MPAIRRTESAKLVCVEQQGSSRALPEAFAGLRQFLSERRVPAQGAPFVILYDPIEQLNLESFHFTAAWELAGETNGDGEHLIVLQPPAWIAAAAHQGPLGTWAEALRQLRDWADREGYRPAGHPRVYFSGHAWPGANDPEWSGEVEVQLPVEKA